MQNARVGDVVWYLGEEPRQQAKIISIEGSTHAFIKLLTGTNKGDRFEAPWGVIQELARRAIRQHGQYTIEANTVPTENGTFKASGMIRRPVALGTGIPIEISFEAPGEYLTVDAAIEAGVAFAKSRIDPEKK